MRKLIKYCGVSTMLAITYSAAAVATPVNAIPMEEGGVFAAIALSVAAGVWIARRKQ